MIDIRALQAPLRARYSQDPTSAPTTLRVRRAPSDLDDPLHCAIRPESVDDVIWRSGAHAAVGGSGDVPCSGDLLLGALAACQEVTLRMVAANQSVALRSVEVEVEGEWDPRGTLAMGRDLPVGLTAIRCRTTVGLGSDVNEDRAARLLRSAERYCVVLQTLRSAGLDVGSTFEVLGSPTP